MHVFSDCLLLSIDPRSASISASISALSSHASSSGTSVGVRRASTAISHMYNTGHGWMGNANASSPALSNTTSAASSASALLPNGTPAQHRQRGSGRGQTNGLLRIVSAFAATSGVAGGGSSSKKQQQQPKHTLQFVIRVTLGDLEVESVGTLDDERIASLLPNASRASERSSSAADSTTAGRIVVLRHLPGASSRDKQVKTPDSSNAPPISRHSSAPETVHNHVSSSHPSYDNYTNTSRPASIHGTLQQSPSTPSPHHNNTHTSLPPPITTTRPQHPQTSTHPGVDRSASGYFTEADRSSSLASPRPMSGVDGDDHHAAYAGGQADAEEQEMYAFRARNSKRMAGLLAALGLAGVGVMKP
ncbi:uncharacterized protein EV422DRAFT_163321 [Fimicolochytrium jonesii]|uniref:uncharacterized protein n=1 Tax=Fimicolochytrium jonesii TaxID=1396493 RepID=UPI0022FEC31F|nr:uncharacterized protein EV422DRAFT_163321 [Fimicolochytrium jonesii]KAI8818744.1 hypothetical protein EV422DRAFT_163321 [Fimicolochytrium jonesii]